ncbi:hypothetical protein J6590_061211 [Homalodisca vitripennis]|nr:hypothetical protein J6590_061211 [Homalodisca vitripennis]
MANCDPQNVSQGRREDERITRNSDSKWLKCVLMDSCFPPLAGLSLRDSDRPPPPPPGVRLNNCGKIEILQDLDLYYIRQIAHNLKWSEFRNPKAEQLLRRGNQLHKGRKYTRGFKL